MGNDKIRRNKEKYSGNQKNYKYNQQHPVRLRCRNRRQNRGAILDIHQAQKKSLTYRYSPPLDPNCAIDFGKKNASTNANIQKTATRMVMIEIK